MRVADMNWSDMEKQIARDDRCVLPIGSTEQHAQLSLCVDAILAERVATEAAEAAGVPVFPVMPYGLAPYFADFPGTVTLRVETLLAVVRDVMASFSRMGFRRVLIVNGHGGNQPAGAVANELMIDHPDMNIKFHNWWNSPQVWAHAREIDTSGSHANWMENFPWTRLAHAAAPQHIKDAMDLTALKAAAPATAKQMLGDGSFGGPYQKDDKTMLALWQTGVDEVREALDGPWPKLQQE